MPSFVGTALVYEGATVADAFHDEAGTSHTSHGLLELRVGPPVIHGRDPNLAAEATGAVWCLVTSASTRPSTPREGTASVASYSGVTTG